MKRLRLNILVIFIVGTISIQMVAQQQPIFNHYMFDQYYINPGAAGSSEKVNMVMIMRDQWGLGGGIEGAPRSSTFGVNAPFSLFGIQHAFGVDALYDELGFNLDFGLKLGYAMRFNVGTGKLGIGVKGGFLYPSLDAKWEYGEGNNSFQLEASNFESLSQYENEFMFDMDVGVFYKTDELYLGLSSVRVHAPTFKPKRTTNTNTLSYDYVRHFYFTTGYSVYLPNPAFEILPSFIIRSDGKLLNFDLNTMVLYNKKIWGGLSYRNDIVSYGMVFFGLELMESLKFGFSYEIPSGDIQKFTGGSLEVLVNYSFTLSKEKTTQRYKSIRYL